jgi:hypothetical protein
MDYTSSPGNLCFLESMPIPTGFIVILYHTPGGARCGKMGLSGKYDFHFRFREFHRTGSRGIHSPVIVAKYHHVTYVTWGNMAYHPGDKSPGYLRTPLTGLKNTDAKTFRTILNRSEKAKSIIWA